MTYKTRSVHPYLIHTLLVFTLGGCSDDGAQSTPSTGMQTQEHTRQLCANHIDQAPEPGKVCEFNGDCPVIDCPCVDGANAQAQACADGVCKGRSSCLDACVPQCEQECAKSCTEVSSTECNEQGECEKLTETICDETPSCVEVCSSGYLCTDENLGLVNQEES